MPLAAPLLLVRRHAIVAVIRSCRSGLRPRAQLLSCYNQEPYYSIGYRRRGQYCRCSSGSSSGSSSNSSSSESISSANKNNDTSNTFTSSLHHKDKQDDDDDDSMKHHPTWWQQAQSPPNLLTLLRLILAPPTVSYLIVTHQYMAAVTVCGVAAMTDAVDGYLARTYDMATPLGSVLDPAADKALIQVVSVSLWYNNHTTTMATATGAASLVVLPTPLVLLWGLKDAVLVAATARHLFYNNSNSSTTASSATLNHHHNNTNTSMKEKNRMMIRIHPTPISKLNTTLQFTTLCLAMMVLASTDVATAAAAAATTLPDADVAWLWNTSILGGVTDPTTLSSWQTSFTALAWLTGATTIASAVSYVDYSGLNDDDDDDDKNGTPKK
jgi:phosphatidylglycerophosphate synthase